MVVAASAEHLCIMGFSEKCLRHAVCFEAERVYWNTFGRSARFRNFIPLCFRSKHKIPEKILKGVDGYEKESVLMGYSGLDDLIGNERSRDKFRENLNGENNDFNATLACKQFPSISVGYFPNVELYDGVTCYSETKESLVPQILEGCFPSRIDANWVDPNCMYHTPDLNPEISDVNAYLPEEKLDESTIYSQSSEWKTETRNTLQLTADEPCSSPVSQIPQIDIPVAEVLDKYINCIPGVNKRQLNQLENCGFHTLRKLLHHFPRTYVDLQNAQVQIDDGQYLIFIGKIKSSRGIRASCSFAFLEVIVTCEVADIELDSECVDNESEDKRKRTIYLHLKKFFRGARFTCAPFLRSIQEKHTEGDTVCVSGKVRTMRNKDHFEMREYNIDLVEDEGDSNVHAKGRPYPIYPSKKGLNPEFLRDVISRLSPEPLSHQ